jgi:lantibiotic modifying enzyme
LPTSRRDFLSSTTLAAAITGLPQLRPQLVALVNRSPRPYLDLALQCAAWIERSRQATDTGTRYPADPLKPESVGLDFYNGMPGIVYFYAALFESTGDVTWLRAARNGADHLIRVLDAEPDLGAGLYTGIAGIAFTLMAVSRIGAGERYSGAAQRALALLATNAKSVGDGVEWSDSNDIIGGTAGIGLLLLHAGDKWHADALRLAARAGKRLLATGLPAEGGTMWFPGGSIQRNYPNFSHGTSGVAYFLATLYQQTEDQAFLDGALAGVRYLDAVANRKDGGTKVFHVSGGGENRYYLSWCHGPVGTARLFYRLHRITGEKRWLDWVDSLTTAVVRSGVPEARTDGYWENISQCCGNVGIGQYCIDLARYHRTETAGTMRERIIKNTMSRSTQDDQGLRWVQAENRTQPENLVAQTGFMQGAAGVGTFFLQLDAFDQGRRWQFPQPDTPFVG